MFFINYYKLLIFLIFVLTSENILGQKKEFRSEKINYIYDKAKFLYDSEPKIEKLKNELKKFDQIVMDLKQSKNQDQKKIYEVDKKMIEMLNKYKLDEAARSFSTKYKHEHSLFVEDSSINKINKFEDFEIKEVQNLWRKTLEINLKDSEKKIIYDMLIGYQNNLKKYYELIENINKMEIDENSIDEDKHNLINLKKKETKSLNNQLEDEYMKIMNKIIILQNNPFLHEIVRKLYDEAITSKKFSEKEEKTLRSELRTLQEQFFRLDYHKSQIEEVSQYGKKEAITEDYKKNEEMAEILRKKVKKYSEYLKNKINPHLEL